jgi:hypothetical protein
LLTEVHGPWLTTLFGTLALAALLFASSARAQVHGPTTVMRDLKMIRGTTQQGD